MSGPPAELVLLLHGQPGAAADWDRVRAAVGHRAHLLAIDRPGWRAGSRPGDLADNAADAMATVDRCGARRVTVVGHSLGGAVAAWMAADYPERVARLILVAPAANRAALVAFDHWLARPVVGELLAAPVLAGAGLGLRVGAVRRWVAAGLALDDRYLQTMGANLRRPAAWRAFAADQRALVRDLPVLEAKLGQITAPTTIVAGAADRVVPLSSAEALTRAIPRTRLVVLEGDDHLLVQRDPERLADIVLAADG